MSLRANTQKKYVHTAAQTSEGLHRDALYNYGTSVREERQSIVPHLSTGERESQKGHSPRAKQKSYALDLHKGDPGRSFRL